MSIDILRGDSAEPTAGGLVFTNNKGHVIFANQAFLDLMQYEKRQPILGKPLSSVLHMTPEDAACLLERNPQGGVGSRAIVRELTDVRGVKKCVQVESIPAYDSHERFLGANIIIKPA